MTLTIDPETVERMKGRYIRRKIKMPRAAGIHKVIELPPDFMRRIARDGGRARMARMTPEQRTDFSEWPQRRTGTQVKRAI